MKNKIDSYGTLTHRLADDASELNVIKRPFNSEEFRKLSERRKSLKVFNN